MKTRILIFATCFLLAACESETPLPEAPEVKIIEVQETGKITAAWEAEALAWEREGDIFATSAENARERAAQARDISLEEALRRGLHAQEWAAMSLEHAERRRDMGLWGLARESVAQAEAWTYALQAWTEVVEATE